MWKFCLDHLSPLPLLLLLFSHSLLVFSQQISFSSSLNLNDNKYFTLKQVLHHGGISNLGKQLFRKLEINQNEDSVFKEFGYAGTDPSGEYVVNFREEAPVGEFDLNNFGKKIPIPNHKDVASVLSLARMSYNAYISINSSGWLDLGDLDYEKLPFGWEERGLRGYVFADQDNSTVIISFKGTSVKYIYDDDETAPNDQYNASFFPSLLRHV
ncbi:15841_t:CDS:2 [Acaulospora colombiana]|uniref:15841_t:CDS:1 n=1 Tax=Acaulospora colombiana TaxID=27376 RepID=A0ACA9KAS6_9GLOM|nr:15841_t:CDS:2 [Acaulospora colombiana]